MALTSEFEYDCEVRGQHKAVQVRVATIVKDDGADYQPELYTAP